MPQNENLTSLLRRQPLGDFSQPFRPLLNPPTIPAAAANNPARQAALAQALRNRGPGGGNNPSAPSGPAQAASVGQVSRPSAGQAFGAGLANPALGFGALAMRGFNALAPGGQAVFGGGQRPTVGATGPGSVQDVAQAGALARSRAQARSAAQGGVASSASQAAAQRSAQRNARRGLADLGRSDGGGQGGAGRSGPGSQGRSDPRGGSGAGPHG